MGARWHMTRGIAAGIAAAACYAPAAPLGVPCSVSSECPTGQSCNPVTQICELPAVQRVWRDDTVEDFAVAGAVLDGVELERGGFVGPIGYLVGGVRVTGIDAFALTDPSMTWDQLAALPVAGVSVARDLELDYGAALPPALGIASASASTILVEAEVELDVAGSWQFELTADDHGFLEIAAPGSDVFVRLVEDLDTTTAATYTATAAGWHRLRGAFGNATPATNFEVRYDPPNQPGAFRDIAADRLRTPVGDLAGLVADGFDYVDLLVHLGTTLTDDSLAALTLSPDPYGLPVGILSWSVRWQGQVLIDVDGTYELALASIDGHRAWLGGQLIVDTIGAGPTTPVPVTLVAGWHDLVVDLQQEGTSMAPTISLTVASGPVWAGAGIPVDHVRPVIGRALRWAANHNLTAVTIPDSGSTSRFLGVPMPADAVPLRIDAVFELQHSLLPTVQVVLAPPTGANRTLAAAGSMSGSGTRRQLHEIPVAHAGTGWSFIVTDTTLDVMTGTLLSVGVTQQYRGGPAPFAPSARYTSAVRELGDIAGLGVLRYGLRQATAATVTTVRLRTCDAADGCASEPWVEVADGTVPAVPARRFAQYQVELTSDGDVPTALDWIELVYAIYGAS